MLNLEGAKIHDFEIFCDSCGENITDNPLRMDMRIFQGNTHGGGKWKVKAQSMVFLGTL